MVSWYKILAPRLLALVASSGCFKTSSRLLQDFDPFAENGNFWENYFSLKKFHLFCVQFFVNVKRYSPKGSLLCLL